MKRRFSLTLILLCVWVSQVLAQRFTLVGKVTDPDMNPVELATVAVPSQGKVTMTSLQGEFRLELRSEDSVAVRFSMVGYRTKTRVLRRPKGKQTLRVILYSDNTLAEVQVTGDKIQTGQTQELDTKDMRLAPSASGNAVESLIQSQAGVSTHNELSSQYNVRGGSFNENSVYINHVEVYRPFLLRTGQQEGLSVINPYMVDRIGFSTGGYAARYGDKMSSALDITYKTLTPKAGQKTMAEATVAASLLGADAYVGFATKRFSWLNSVRYKTNRYLLGSMDTHGEYRPNFLDYQTYLTYQPTKNWKIDFIGNISDNHYDFEPEDRETTFGTQADVKNFRVYFDGKEKDRFLTYFGSLGITRQLGKNTSVSLLASAFYSKEKETYDIQGQYWLDQTETSQSLGVGTYFEHARNYLEARVWTAKLMLRHKTMRHDWEAAVTFKREHVKENSVEYEMRDSAGYSIPHTGEDLYMIYSLNARNQLDANRVEAYLQDAYRFTSKGGHTHFTLNYGLRLSHWDYNGETILSPRVSLAIVPPFSQNTTFRMAAGLYYQAPFFKELRDTSTVNGITYATLNPDIKSQRSIHFILGYDYRFRLAQRRFRFSAEAYYKALGNLVPYSVNNVKVVYYGNNLCSGHAMGLDMKLYGEFVPGTDSWLSLSLMDTRMKLNGRSIPLPTDQRYAINLYFTDYFPGTTRWRMSLRLAWADGLPFSAPHQELETNQFRAPAYRRADIGMSYLLFDNRERQRKNLFKSVWLGVDCLNLLGIDNVSSYYWVTDVTNHQYAVPNYLTGRQLNVRVLIDF